VSCVRAEPGGGVSRFARRRALLIFAAVGALALLPRQARADFQLGIQDPAFDGAASAQQAAAGYAVLRSVGGSYVRVNAYWSAVAPTEPASAAAAENPANPGYDWTALDQAVRRAAVRHVHVLLMLAAAPVWAQGPGHPSAGEVAAGAWDPNPTRFGQFARAVAARYSGSFGDPLRPGRDLPRVSDYEIWNEENAPLALAAPKPVAEYRSLLNAGYSAIKSVHADDRVALGGLSPVANLPRSVAPLPFASDLLCLRHAGNRLVRAAGCRPAHFDAIADHPYTLAVTPTDPGARFGDILVADVGKLRQLLNVARRLRTIGPEPHPLWITEWEWLTNPPDTELGDPYAAAARYIAYSMYEMWRARASLIIWQGIHDETPNYLAGAGLETPGGRPKPSLRAFAFPFVAVDQGEHGLTWGRVPSARRGRVTIQLRRGGRWRPAGSARADGDGVFSVRLTVVRGVSYRAVAAGGQVSLPYLAVPIPPQATHHF
jgi:hypothetical protein